MTIASDTRAALERHPFVRAAVLAGVANYTATARYLDVGDEDAVAAALRRLHDERPATPTEPADVRIRMQRGLTRVESDDEALIAVGDARFGSGTGDATGIIASGLASVGRVSAILARLAQEAIEPLAVGTANGTLIIVVPGRSAASVIRAIETTSAVRPTD